MTKSKERDYDADMKLPEGKTCDDCRHDKRCFAFGYSKSGRTSCDFWPNKFQAKKPVSLSELSNAELANCLQHSCHKVITEIEPDPTVDKEYWGMELIGVQMTRRTLERICAALRASQ